MLMVLAGLQMLPQELLDAAKVDGASPWQVTRHVTLPFIQGVLLVAGLFRLIDSIKAFPLIYILTDGGPGSLTEVTNYYSFLQAFNFSYLGSPAPSPSPCWPRPWSWLADRAHRRVGCPCRLGRARRDRES